MRILLTGATGFIGSHLVARLAQAGHACVALSRSASRAQAKLPQLTAAHDWSLLDGPPPAEALEGVEAVIHLAGETVVGRWTKAKKRAIRETRVVGTEQLLRGLEAMATPPRVLLSTSAIGFYGDRGDERLTESAGPGDDFLAEVCRDWEAAAAPAKQLGIRVAHPRIGLVLHPTGGALEAMLTPFKLGLGGPLGSGRQWWAWIHLDDLLGLFERALSDPAFTGPFNATAPHPRSQREFARALARALGRPAFVPAPRLALRLALGGFAAELLSSRRAEPELAMAQGFGFRFPDLESALNDLLSA
jgi:uncharacterized protein (TIGR01777 family)